MIPTNVVQHETMAVPGFEHQTFMCSECQDVERRLVFIKHDCDADTNPMPEQAAPPVVPASAAQDEHVAASGLFTRPLEPAQTVPVEPTQKAPEELTRTAPIQATALLPHDTLRANSECEYGSKAWLSPRKLPVERDDPACCIKLARYAMSLVQSQEKTVNVLVHRLDFRELRQNGRDPFLKLVPGFGQLLNAVPETDTFIPLKASKAGGNSVLSVE